MAPFRGWAVLPVIGTGVDPEDAIRPDLRGVAAVGDRVENIISGTLGRCLVACDISDDARLAAGVTLCSHDELATILAALPAARRTRIAAAAALLGENDMTGTIAAVLRRIGRRVPGFDGFLPNLHLGSSPPPVTGSFVNDTFTDASATILTSHTGETGATWTKHGSSAAGDLTVETNRLAEGTSNRIYYASGTPAGVEYTVTAVYDFLGTTTIAIGACGRMDTAANTFYMGRISAGSSVELFKRVAGTFTSLGTYGAPAIGSPETHTIDVEIKDATKKLFYDGTERISSTDNVITAAGRVGVRSNGATATTGGHITTLTGTNPVGGQTIAIGQATVTGTTNAITPSKRAAVGQATVTSTGQAITPKKTRALPTAIVTSTANAITPIKGRVIAVGQAVVTSTAQTVTPKKAKAIGQAVVTSIVNAITAHGGESGFQRQDPDVTTGFTRVEDEGAPGFTRQADTASGSFTRV